MDINRMSTKVYRRWKLFRAQITSDFQQIPVFKCGLISESISLQSQKKVPNYAPELYPLKDIVLRQRENTLRDSLQKFITLHKARSVYR